MLDVRSRAGVVAVTTGVAVLFALPVVASGQVPGVDQVVGDVQETVDTVAPAPVGVPLPAPPVSVPAPVPKPQSAPPATSAPAPSSSAPVPQRTSAPAASTESGSNTSSGSAKAASAAGGRRDGGAAKASAAPGGESATATQDGDPATDVAVASQVSDVQEANPSTLPFTGFQLALLAGLGLTALAGGLALRRGARTTG